jgi:hypothetical protein
MSAYKTVYRVQCKTAGILRDLWQLPENVATTPEHPLMFFRLLPAYRCAKSLALRKMVADKMRDIRKASKD